MATLSRGQTFGATETITNTKLHNLVDLGSISALVNADCAAAMGLVDTKLADITTAGKVNGSALTGLTNTPSGAGVIPAANLTSVAQKGANSDITSLAGLTTPLSIAQGGTGKTTADWQIKGWVQFNGTGTLAIADSYNVDSVTDNGTGDYTINWDTDFANDDYAVGVATDQYIERILAKTNGTIQVTVYDANNSAVDASIVDMIAIGDQ
ncbi:hypothetical protein AYK26_07715 [Euryarchaeota archaeon SM23-78]|nr:MAG: hypothetical protein AYK26_07715 [Euryarchaeota archaeon SM23-78]